MRGDEQLSLLIIGEGFVGSFTLPKSGDVIIGRGAEAQVRIDRPSISRKHARLRIGTSMVLEDLGSSNGTRVRNATLEPGKSVEVTVGDSIELGSTMLILQRRSTAVPPRQVWTHSYFETRLDEECARAGRTGSPFALVRLHVQREPEPGAAQRLLLEMLRQGDIFASYAPNECEMLVLDAGAEQSESIVRELCTCLARQGTEVRSGIAFYPRDGRAPAQLMARACDGARGVPRSEDSADEGEVMAGPAPDVMQHLERLMERVAAGMINVLLVGETGVGKERAAERIHRLSPRRDQPLLRLNCAALSETLLESELFGHERGAFTGAVQTKPGLLEAAAGGTVFLDEIGDLPASLQAKLLRVLEERQILRVGAVKQRPIDVRFISATNRDLQAAMDAGTFRQDLYFRLNGITLFVAPLRERVSEIEPLARAFVAQASHQLGRAHVPVIADEALAALRAYTWPGNIRELRNFMDRAVLLCTGGEITPEHLPIERMRAAMATQPVAQAQLPIVLDPSSGFADPNRRSDFEDAQDLTDPGTDLPPERPTPPVQNPPEADGQVAADERERILDALARCGGNQTRAADLLGISRRTLTNRLNAFDLPRPRKGR